MKEKLEKEMLVSLTIDGKELQWVKKGKEILVGGRMFDIKTIHFDGKKYKITGLFDDDETALDKKLEEQQKKESSSEKFIAHLMHLIQGVFFDTQVENSVLVKNQNLFEVSNNTISSSPFRSVPTPPPQIV